jgi:hypothetical protein
VSVATGGAQGLEASTGARISADGRFVAFESLASNLVVGDTNSAIDVFVRDRVLATTERVSVGPAGVQGSFESLYPSISADGRFVAFASGSSNFVPGDTGWSDVFVRDRQNGTTERASVDSGGAQPDGSNLGSALSPDGRFVAFFSLASNLVAGDANGVGDVFLRDLDGPFALPFCAGDGTLTDHTTGCPCGNDGAAGRGCAHSADAAGAGLSASGATALDSVVLHGSGMPATVACIYLQGDALDDAVFGDGVRCTGGTLLRLRTKVNVGGASSFPDATDTVTLSTRGGVVPGSGVRRYYQTYYRNSAPLFCPPATFNVTNGRVIDW